MKKLDIFIVSILLATTHLFAQKTENLKKDSNNVVYCFGPPKINFTTNTLVINPSSISKLDRYKKKLDNVNFIKKYNVVMFVSTCPKEEGKPIGFERAKIIIDYFHYKYGIDRKHFFIKLGDVVFNDNGCYLSGITLGLDLNANKYLTNFKERKGVFYHTIHFKLKSLVIDSNDYTYLDSLALNITADSLNTNTSFFKKYNVYFLIHCCEEEENSFMGLQRAKVILDYLYNKYKIKRYSFLLQLPDSYTKDCNHSTIDIVILPESFLIDK